jgi:mycothiol synthase
MRAMLTETIRIDGWPCYAAAGDLDWWRASDPTDRALQAAHLWFDGDQLLAFAWPDNDGVDLFTLPRYRALEADMLDWAEEWRRSTGTADAAPLTLKAWSLEEDARRQALLRVRGYERTDLHLIYWLRLLDPPPQFRPISLGYTIRNVKGEGDIESRVAAHRSAFAPSKFTVEKYRRTRSMPGYREDMDIVAVTPDGTVAAFCIIWYDGVTGIGLFEPVGAHADHQQRGLARAVLVEGMRRLVGLGAHSAVVLSTGGRDPSYRLYQSAGFRVLDRNYAWERVIG